MPRARGIIRKVVRARGRVSESIHRDIDRGSRYSGALSSEGWAGGYLQALDDILLLLSGVEPRTRGFWEASKKDKDNDE